MMNFILIGIICLIVLIPIHDIHAQEQFGPGRNNDVIEWEDNVQKLIKEKKYEEAVIYLDKILEAEPDNKEIAILLWKILEKIEFYSTVNSPYTIHVQVIVRNLDGNLLGVLESSNANYLPSKFFEDWLNMVEKKGLFTEMNGSKIIQVHEIMTPEHHHTGKFHWDTSIDNHPDLIVNLFNVFVPLMEIDMETERSEVILTFVKN